MELKEDEQKGDAEFEIFTHPRETFLKLQIRSLLTRAASNQERVIMAQVQYIREEVLKDTKIGTL